MKSLFVYSKLFFKICISVHANEVRKTEAKASGKKGAPCKRFPVEPKTAHMVSTKDNEPQFLAPIPYEFMA